MMNTNKGIYFLASACMAATGFAQEEEGDWKVIIGAGVFIEPITPGLSETEADPLPYINIQYKNRFFIGKHGIGGYVYKMPDEGHDEGFGVGLAVGMADGRKEDDYSSFLKGMGDIDEGLEANLFFSGEVGFAEYEWSFSKGLDSKGHDGLHSELSISVGAPVMKNLFLEVGPFIHWSDSNYMQSFYGVTDVQASLSQFDEYTPGSGIDRVGLEMIGRTRLTDRWLLMGMVEYNSLLGDAKDSPLSEDNSYVSFGLAIGYEF
ncbi:MipA/OmpV family protein [Puniceicoccaceae bacterium K14]|nr:MipA/OmpV family protein [Puniceicoccaceae bacterium K14]